MKLSAHYIALFATALANDDELVEWCVDNFGRPPLIRKQENPANPLDSEAAPWICLLSWTGAEMGEVVASNSCSVNVTVGISDAAAADVESMSSAVRVLQERTDEAAGIEEVGDAELAETFLTLVVASIIKSSAGALIETAGAESDGWSQYPLQIASAVLAVRQPPNTF